MSRKMRPEERIGSIPPFGLRMPAALRDRVTETAKINNRSVNAEIVARLEASLNGEIEPKAMEGIMAQLAPLMGVTNQMHKLLQDQEKLNARIDAHDKAASEQIADLKRKIAELEGASGKSNPG